MKSTLWKKLAMAAVSAVICVSPLSASAQTVVDSNSCITEMGFRNSIGAWYHYGFKNSCNESISVKFSVTSSCKHALIGKKSLYVRGNSTIWWDTNVEKRECDPPSINAYCTQYSDYKLRRIDGHC